MKALTLWPAYAMAIAAVLAHCHEWPENTYVFQTKNPARLLAWYAKLPARCIVGTTIESDIAYPEIMRAAPPPLERIAAMISLNVREPSVQLFVTIEPMLHCDPLKLASLIKMIRPAFVNIGIDSKGHGLPEPSATEIRELIAALKLLGVDVREKHNLERLLK